MSSLSLFEVPVTTAATVTALVTVEADSVEQANSKALAHVRSHGAPFALDDDSIHWNEAYLPDPLTGTDEAPDPLSFRGVDESLPGLSLVYADRNKRRQALLLDGKILQVSDSNSESGLEELAENLARALGTVWHPLYCLQDGDDWEWADVVTQLTEDAPATEAQLCDELEVFCRREGLPDYSADELLCESLTVAQEAWLKRFVARWESVVG